MYIKVKQCLPLTWRGESQQIVSFYLFPKSSITDFINIVKQAVTILWYRPGNRVKSPIYSANSLLPPSVWNLPISCMRSPSVPSAPFISSSQDLIIYSQARALSILLIPGCSLCLSGPIEVDDPVSKMLGTRSVSEMEFSKDLGRGEHWYLQRLYWLDIPNLAA